MLDINSELFEQVVETAKINTGDDARWINAIDHAVEMLDGNPYAEWRAGELLILSNTSFNVYTANGACQCTSFEFGMPCKHRAAAQLVRRYYEALAHREAETDLDGQVETAVLFGAPLPQTDSARRVPNGGSAGDFGGEGSRVERLPVHMDIKVCIAGGRRVETVRGIRI